MTKIRDENFPTVDQINSTPCYTADRFLNKVDESVIITQVCQDSNITSLVILDFVLVGAFNFTPSCKILEVDGDTSFTTAGVVAPLAVGHYKNPSIPIETNCQTYHGQLVFDFGAVIPTFTTAVNIKFQLVMVGDSPQSFGVSFPSQTVVSDFSWTKGILPSPININYVNGIFNIVFEYKGSVNCSCAIQCIVPSGTTQNIQFCPNQSQVVNIYNGDLSDDPVNYYIQLVDSLGNSSILSVQPIIGTVPRAPTVTLNTSPRKVEIGISKTSINNVAYDEQVEYQILKYNTSTNNLIIWKDWSNRPVSSFFDLDTLPNAIYGYAVRFRGKFNDESSLSDWTIVRT